MKNPNPNPDSSSFKMFIQCVQVDLTRCLKPGTVVLYKVMLLILAIIIIIIIKINVISQKPGTSEYSKTP